MHDKNYFLPFKNLTFYIQKFPYYYLQKAHRGMRGCSHVGKHDGVLVAMPTLHTQVNTSEKNISNTLIVS